MTGGDLATVAAVVFAYAALSGRLQGTVITPAMVFVVVGLAVGVDGLGWIEPHATVETVKILTSATLTVVLFTDAMRIDVPVLRREAALPERLLGVGLPLTIAAGTAAALALFPDLGLWPAAVLATVLAPTDAALGQAVVTDPTLPSRVRQGLNVESGLNDGLCVPLLAIFLTLAESEEHLTTGDALRVILEEIGGGLAGGLLAGALGALVLGYCIRRQWVEPAWHQIALLMVPIGAYGAAVAFRGSGFIAAFVAGLVFGRLAGRTGAPTYLADQVGELLAALTFLIFGAVALGPVLGDLTWAIVAYAVLSLTLVRMVPVAVALVGSRPRPVTVGFVGWFGPRGLASIVFALDLVGESGLEEAPLIVRVVGLTVALSVLLHGLSAAPAARRYGEWYSHHEQREDLAESGPAIEVRPTGPACSAVGRSRSEPRSALVVVDRCGLAGDGSQEGDHAPAQGWGGEGGGDRPGAFRRDADPQRAGQRAEVQGRVEAAGPRRRRRPRWGCRCRPRTPASTHSRTARNRWIRPAASAATNWAASAAPWTSAVDDAQPAGVEPGAGAEPPSRVST